MQVLFRATDRLYATTDRVFRVVECRACRLIRLDPRPTPQELERYYPPSYWFQPEASAAARLAQFYRRTVLLDHVRFVQRALRASGGQGLVVDVGCGGGLFLELLRQHAPPGAGPFAGLDFSLDAASIAWHRSGVPAVCASLTAAPFRDGSCAVITMFHVLEHLYDPAAYLDAAYRLLAPGGRLVVQVPNAASWQFLLFGERWNGIDVPRHLIHFRAADLKQLLEACGFEILRHKYFSLRDNPAGLATSLAPALDPMSRRLRGVSESPRARLFKDAVYFALVIASLPFTALEAACRAGATVMVEARKRPRE
jgi:SAM-dependent methyltransferase